MVCSGVLWIVADWGLVLQLVNKLHLQDKIDIWSDNARLVSNLLLYKGLSCTWRIRRLFFFFSFIFQWLSEAVVQPFVKEYTQSVQVWRSAGIVTLLSSLIFW